MMLPRMQKNTPESNETRPDTIDRKIRRFRPNMTWHMTSYLRDLSPQGVKIFRTCVKLINTKALKVSLQSDVFYVNYLRKTMGGRTEPPLQVRGLSPIHQLLAAKCLGIVVLISIFVFYFVFYYILGAFLPFILGRYIFSIFVFDSEDFESASSLCSHSERWGSIFVIKFLPNYISWIDIQLAWTISGIAYRICKLYHFKA